MNNRNENYQIDCISCDLPTQERLHYFTGQFLTQRDFQDEQNYFIGKHRQHNRYLHGYGTVCGLKVVQHPNPDCRDRFVILEPGFALDCCGREILVKEQIYIDVIKYFAAQNIDLNSIKPEDANHLLFSLCYSECKTEFVPALYAECGCDEMGSDANRIYEGFEVQLQLVKELPKLPHSEPVGVSLNWTNTLNLAQASRLALDGKHLYVLTAANPSQILVYEAENSVLIRSIDVGVRGVDLAVSPEGKYLYIIRDKTAADATDNYFLQVLNVENLSVPPPTVNILPLGNALIDLNNPPQVLVAAADGKVYTLDPQAKKVIVWKTSINTPGVDPNLPVGDANSPKYAEIDTGNEPRAIALSPDGIWLFVADSITNEVKAFKIETLNQPPASRIIQTIALGESPRLLAVAGDSSRLYVVTFPATGNKKVRAFGIQETPSLFPEISTSGGIDFGSEEPVAMTASRSGRWLYLLLKDSSPTPKGIIKVVDVGQLATNSSHAVSPSIPVVTNPQDILLDPEKGRLYAAGRGAATPPPYGGVSILEVTEEQCSENVWRAVDGCPDCPEDACVPLAVVEDYIKNYQNKDKAIVDAKIDNRKVRPLVPSTETLRQLVLCALESRGGTQSKQGPPGSPGTPGAPGSKWLNGTTNPTNTLVANPGDYYLNTSSGDVYRREIDSSWTLVGNIKGSPGNDGAPGEGLESGLTQIKALSWIHNTENNRLATIIRSNRDEKVLGIVITFSNPVLVSNPSKPLSPPNQIDADHVFQVLAEYNPELIELGVICRCPLKGNILPVKPADFDSQGRITVAEEIEGPMAEAAAFIFDNKTFFFDDQGFPRFSRNERRINELWTRLRGDFVLDNEEPTKARAIDAEFVRGELPTGDRPRGSNFGIQGGTFESWFWIGDRPKPQDPQ